jgi:hypothetical protein
VVSAWSEPYGLDLPAYVPGRLSRSLRKSIALAFEAEKAGVVDGQLDHRGVVADDLAPYN